MYKGLGRGGKARIHMAAMKQGFYSAAQQRALAGMNPRKRRRSTVARTTGPWNVSESKYFDTETSAFAVAENTTNWASTNDVIKGLICVPTEGSDIDNRVGRRISVYKIAVRGIIYATVLPDQADVVHTPDFRCILWMDTQCNATVTDSSVLMQGGTAATPLVPFTAFQNTANLGRFRVLKDKIYRGRDVTVGTDGASTLSEQMDDVTFKLTHKFKTPVTVRFNAANAGAIGDIVNVAFYLSIQKSGTGFAHATTVRTRAYYKDL